MITTLCAYFLIIVFVVMQERLRRGQDSKSFERGQFDRGSTVLVGAGFGLTFILLLLAPLLNHFGIAVLPAAGVTGGVGVLLMLVGIGLRYWASRTLGQFYTRTLLMQTEQRVVETGPYHFIRHPGYLGDLIMFIGAGAAVVNWIALLVIAAVMFGVYAYRIRVEEQMLLQSLGEPYRRYMAHTWRLIPWLY